MRKFVLEILILFLISTFCYGQVIIKTEFRTRPLPFGLVEKVPIQKPKVAFVLSGGGARGVAQIGVIKALIENGIEPDFIVGTSFGSIVGGLFASGYSVKQLDSIVTKTNWTEIISFSQQIKRSDLFIDQKITADRSILTLQLKGLKPIIPTSVSSGQKLINFLNQLVIQAPIHPRKNFDELLIPFRAVCTDLISGKPVILSEGDLAEAMRASSSVTFFLSPIQKDTLLLADGGLVANIPVKIAKNLGADIVIAINTTSPLRSAEELQLPWYLADQVVSIPLKTLEQLDLKEADFVITPKIQHSATDFTQLDSLIDEGYKEGILYIKEIQEKITSIYEENLKKNEHKISCLSVTNESYKLNPLLHRINLNDNSPAEVLKKLYDLCTTEYEYIELVYWDNLKTCEVNFIGKPIIKKILVNGEPFLNKFEFKPFSSLIGRPFIPKEMVNQSLEVLKKFRENNFSLINIEKIDFDPKSGLLNINFTSGKIDSVIIIGQNKTKYEIIDREILVKPQKIFSVNDLKKSLINLEATNLFENVFAFYQQIENRENLIIKVKEKITSLLRIGIRADNERNLQLAIDLRDENFEGTGNELGIQFWGGLRNQYLGFEQRANRILKTYFNYKFKIYFSSINHYYFVNEQFTDLRWSRKILGDYTVNRVGTSLSLGAQVEKLGTIYLEGKREWIKLNVHNLTNLAMEKHATNTIKLGSIFDALNKYPYPTHGVYMNLFFETALRLFKGEISYSRLYFYYEDNVTYNNRHTLTPRLIFGFSSENIPFYEQFKFGGMNYFYGYREGDQLGRQVFITSLEYRLLMPFKIFFNTYFKMRYDLGGVWPTTSSIKFDELKHGIGLGLGFDTPIGPANFTVGRAFYIRNDLLNKPLSLGDYIFYFEIGYPLL